MEVANKDIRDKSISENPNEITSNSQENKEIPKKVDAPPRPPSPVLFREPKSRNFKGLTEKSGYALAEFKPAENKVAVLNEDLLKQYNIQVGISQQKNHVSGTIEKHFVNDQIFNEQFYSSRNKGAYANPNKSDEYIIEKLGKRILISPHHQQLLRDTEIQQADSTHKKLKESRLEVNDPERPDFLGPWAPYRHELPFLNGKIIDTSKFANPKNEFFLKDKPQAKFPGEMDPYYPPRKPHDVVDTNLTGSSTFHLESRTNYQGESFILPPKDKPLKDLSKNFIPTSPLHVYRGHTKEISVAKFFPKHGHFILSASFDTTVKLWDVYNTRSLIQTYNGHSAAVKDICFNNDGTHFLSAGFDARIRFWDTEYGKVVNTFNVQKHPYCVRINPDEDRQHLFLNASMNSKIEQYDLRTSEKVVQYDDHSGPVNTLLFVDNNKKFVSCGDDKKILMWEFGVPVIIRNINEPQVQSITTTTLHPSQDYFAAQTADNKIVVFDVKASSLRLVRGKKFMGHFSAGYAIGTTFSPNGKYLFSGDQDGRIFSWDWKTAAPIQVFKAHNNVCIGIDWHPNEPSMMLSCSWDKTIKLWGK